MPGPNDHMHTSNMGMLFILSYEAIVTRRYKDQKGIWTIGAGVTHSAHPVHDPLTFKGDITVAEAMAEFRKLLVPYENDVKQAFTRELTQEQFDAAVSFHWNTGRILSASWVKDFNNHASDHKIEHDIMLYHKPASLVPRRKAEMHLFIDQIYPHVDHVNVYTADDKGHVLWRQGKQYSTGSILAV